ncbi:hypothetical protein M409DRAFT_17149 [Zasmidium cellare ATCC 36951]|uniref:Uncharacterized protein n=1 Tax=Zasmidium cellare ATCC 36951 TaxID=1080233 RepID=A0A6A6D1A5_ZASCE|nr:uncharacterized protein M409DRAFT_17149 [Zasmidium cellare ATCC 36951]KAF2173204.1 hypothetical protein M409DRAFT_17149 [Zasmidium cellare ATCC 36951]
MGDTARYFHTSLYSFSATARTAILTRFNAAVGHGTVKCWYDTDRETFVLECPNALGIAAQADEQLGAVIETYVRQELVAAEEDERPPTIKRFKEALFIDLNEIAQDPEEVEVVPVQSVQARAHLIKTSESEGKRLKFMPLYSLPDRLLERTLAPENAKVNKVLIDGLTCRAVRWHTRDGEVFNGRTGVGLSLANDDTVELQLPEFSILRDERNHGVDVDGLPAKTWEHVGDPPTVEQWVQGTGQTRQVEPGERPNVPTDARKYLAAGPANPGRLRVPKGQGLLPSPLPPPDEPTTAPVGTESEFNKLLAGEIGDSETDEEEEAGSDTNETSENDLTAILTRGSKKSTQQGDWDSPGLLKPQPRSSTPSYASAANTVTPLSVSRKPSPAAQVLDDRSNNSTPTNTTTSTLQNHPVPSDFPEYGSRHATVDPVGLMGNAANAAQWARDNHVHRSPKKKSKRVMPRSTATRDRSRATETSTSRAASIASFNSQSTVRQDPREADWVNKPVMGRAQGRKLIDDAAAITSGPVRVPPGLEYTTGSSNTPDHTDDGSDGEIHESVKQLPLSYATKRDTMRQKAGKKSKSKKVTSKLPVPKAQLPLPEPPPPPKRKQKEAPIPVPVQTPIPNHTVPSTTNAAGSSGEAAPLREIATDSTSIEHHSHAFGKFLLAQKERIREEEDDEDEEEESDNMSNRVKLVASIGVLLTRPMSKDFNRGVLTPTASQKQLNASWYALRTDMFTRLTTSKEDAAHIINLIGGNTEATTVYEIWVHDGSGTQLMINVPSQQKMDYTVKLQDQVLAEAYAHFPMHVWDAMFALVKPGADHISPSDDAIKEFVSSMQTEDGGPSFKALERVGLLTVQRVLAKRIFTKKAKGGTVLHVTQVQDMGIESLNEKLYNFQAMTLSHIEMVDLHRLWWEARWEVSDLDKAGVLEKEVDEMVRGIDAVGLEDIGPYHYGEPESDDETAAVPVVPFW